MFCHCSRVAVRSIAIRVAAQPKIKLPPLVNALMRETHTHRRVLSAKTRSDRLDQRANKDKLEQHLIVMFRNVLQAGPEKCLLSTAMMVTVEVHAQNYSR